MQKSIFYYFNADNVFSDDITIQTVWVGYSQKRINDQCPDITFTVKLISKTSFIQHITIKIKIYQLAAKQML